ncbi:glucokinase [Dyella sp. ASV21]|uniref:glucokinase n=1 Tax=Dyella sp. ASV21 TaxID=2795114 RepID=UPI0018EDF5D2|nr:glucokinase [Dyella sp. ASV21]
MAEHAWSLRPTAEPSYLLAADVGGTHARLGLVSFQQTERGAGITRPDVSAYRVYPCAAYPGIDAIVRAFCKEHDAQPRRFALACAGYLHDGRVINRHLHWPIEPAALEQALSLDEVRVLNDFEALAHATAYLHDSGVTTVHAPREVITTPGPVVVVGPGTGLGVAVRLPGTRSRVLATEAGHIALAARVGREQQVLQALVPVDTHMPYDHVLSGPGLLRLYQTLCRMEGVPPVADEPATVVAAACAGQDAQAAETLQLFCAWLGSFVGDLAMLYGATGGIYLAGGFLSRMTGFLAQSAFVERFLDKGVMRPFQQTVPVHVVDHAQLGVIGAASWLMERSIPPATG